MRDGDPRGRAVLGDAEANVKHERARGVFKWHWVPGSWEPTQEAAGIHLQGLREHNLLSQ